MTMEEISKLTKADKAIIFDTVDSFFMRLKGDKRKIAKHSFCNTWKLNKSVGCFELMILLYRGMEKLDKAETNVSDDINSGHVDHDWETQTVPWRRHRGICLTLQEEIEELTDQLAGGSAGGKGFISKDEHYDEMKDLKHELKQKYEDEIRSLEKQIVRDKFTRDKEIRSAELDAKRQAFLDKQQEALAKIKDAGMNIPVVLEPVAEQLAPLEPADVANNS